MFVFLFGISMDYHVFILSRIRELWSRGSSAHDAVVGGISSSAGVVTSAALIMVAVFSIFATLPLIDLKILGHRHRGRGAHRRHRGPRRPGARRPGAARRPRLARPPRAAPLPRLTSGLHTSPPAAASASPTGVRRYRTERPDRARLIRPASRSTAS